MTLDASLAAIESGFTSDLAAAYAVLAPLLADERNYRWSLYQAIQAGDLGKFHGLQSARASDETARHHALTAARDAVKKAKANLDAADDYRRALILNFNALPAPAAQPEAPNDRLMPTPTVRNPA